MVNDDASGLGIEDLPTTLLIDAEGRLPARQASFGLAPDEWIASWKRTVYELNGGTPPYP